MSYRIDFSSTAKAEADAAFLRFSQFAQPERAQEWYQGLMKAVSSLQQMPNRCGLARENDFFSQEVRQLIYGRGKSTYRVLFTILEDQKVPTVRILHVRNAAQRTVGEAEDDEANG
jgi:plasmid stabilization system protein ParE